MHDQMYEIRSLLQLETSEKNYRVPIKDEELERDLYLPLAQPNTTYDLNLQLQKYIDKAEGLMGVDHLGYLGGKSPRFLDLSLDGYAVDRRRLFESFKEEEAGALFIFEPNEKKFIFINPAIKSITGWGAEKFVKEFPRLLVKGKSEWGKQFANIGHSKKSSLKIMVYTKSGESKPLDCALGLIVKGPFANHVMGLFS